jgi:hypothetical protein
MSSRNIDIIRTRDDTRRDDLHVISMADLEAFLAKALASHNELALISKAELAQNFSVSTWTITNWVKHGLFPPPFSPVDGGPARWRIKDILAHINKRKLSRKKRRHRGAVKRRIEARDRRREAT